MIRKLSLLICLTFILSTAVQVAAQDAPDVVLYGFVWKTVSITDHTVMFDASKTGNKKEDYSVWSEPTPYQGRQTHVFYEPEVMVENRDQKTIRAITWECVFFRDEAKTRVLKKYKFHTKKLIAAGERSVLKGNQSYNRVPLSATNSLRVLKVEYDDGSVWRRP
jgi:hypothetical protein